MQVRTVPLRDTRLVHCNTSLYHHQLAIRQPEEGLIAYVDDLVAPGSDGTIVIVLARGVIHLVGQPPMNASLFHPQLVTRRAKQRSIRALPVC